MVIASDTSPRCPLPMPWGWFQVLYSDELAVGESKPLRCFDQELVIFAPKAALRKYWMRIARIWVRIWVTASEIRLAVAPAWSESPSSARFMVGDTTARGSAPTYRMQRICRRGREGRAGDCVLAGA